ncbi:hypothetical protein HHI36_019851 [Cryptolaemus montrouzieri]|uniref:Uncharacterized protein n=1 Tax=Cryptolaemus montrouzieri TaxID=559131 RepID=A0ABD2N8Z4_9CUCU
MSFSERFVETGNTLSTPRAKDETDTSKEEDVENLCDDKSEYSEEETLCAICCEMGKSNGIWYRCRSWGKWAYRECSGFDRPVDYIAVRLRLIFI